MNKAFLRFRDTVAKSGLIQGDPILMRELKHVADTFATLVKPSVSESSDEGDEEVVGVVSSSVTEPVNINPSVSSTQLPATQLIDVGWGYSTTVMSTNLTRN